MNATYLDVTDHVSFISSKQNSNAKLKQPEWSGSPKKLLGMSKLKKAAIEFTDESSMIFPSGHSLSLLNIKDDSVKYYSIESFMRLNAIYFLREHKLAALEYSYDANNSVFIEFMGIDNGVRIKSIENVNCSHLIDFKMSYDGKYFVTQGCQDLWELSYWSYDELKLICKKSLAEAPFDPLATVNEISFYPNSSDRLLTIGNFRFVSYSIVDDVIIQDWIINDKENLLSHLWLTSSDLLISDDNSCILQFNLDKKFFSAKIQLNRKSYLKKESEINQSNSFSNFIEGELTRGLPDKCFIRQLVGFSKGFLVLAAKNEVYIYLKRDSVFQQTLHNIKFSLDDRLSRFI